MHRESTVMSSSRVITFRSPPLPFFVESNRNTYRTGEAFPNRTSLGLFDLVFVSEGYLFIAEGTERWKVGPGEALILRPDCWHYSYEPCQETTVFDWLHFQAAGPWEEVEAFEEGVLHGDYYTYAIRIPKYMKLSYSKEVDNLLEELHHAAASSTHSAFWERQQRFLHLLQLLDEGWRKDIAKASLAVAEKAASYLKMNYRNPVSNSMLSEALQLHINYITRSMTEVFDCTPQQFLLNYRIDQAKLLLIKTDWPIAKIALETGFKQTPHFSRLFTNQVGIPPLRYRKKFTA